MTQEFDREFWERHWQEGASTGSGPEHPYLEEEIRDLEPGTALDAGCGTGAESLWLARRGWRVTGVDVSSSALARAAERAAGDGLADRVRWVQADLTTWRPETAYDLVTSSYAHTPEPQLALYARIASWVAPGGTLMIVGHGPSPGGAGHGHGHGSRPEREATATAAAVAAFFDDAGWDVVTATERRRTAPGPHGGGLEDVVVRVRRRAGA